jgi:KipI family sensor histidine kinase inhibitor
MFQYFPSGDAAIIAKAGNVISEEVNRKVRDLLSATEKAAIPGILDFIPSYNELMICYDPVVVGWLELIDRLKALEKNMPVNTEQQKSVTSLVPVLYGGESGPDLKEVAAHAGLTEEEVIRIHGAEPYMVYMLGFTPGFCYLGGVDRRIAIPRKQKPRLRIPAGAVGIAGTQTGIYPIESPGGWQLIGQTPIRLFDPHRNPPFLFRPGDLLKFISIQKEEYFAIQAEVENGSFSLRKYSDDPNQKSKIQ